MVRLNRSTSIRVLLQNAVGAIQAFLGKRGVQLAHTRLSAKGNRDDVVEPFASSTHIPIEAIHLILQSIHAAATDRSLRKEASNNAEAICRVLLELSVDEYGASGKEILIRWGLGSSEAIGDIIDRMTEARILIRGPQDQSSDYVGLYDLAKPPSTWKLQWQ